MTDANSVESRMPTHNKATGAFASVTTLFFAWGFITSLVDPLVAAVKGIFNLSNVEAQLSAFAFFIAYGIISIPAAILVRSEEHTSELQSLMRISYAVFCLKKKIIIYI